MQISRQTALLALVTIAATGTAHAGASDWHRTEGAAVRLVTMDAAEKDGTLRGIVQIRLQPGWKTYWREPGDSGVPPTLTVSAGADDVAMRFPAPQLFDDGYSVWAGYDASVNFPVTFSRAAKPDDIAAELFIGVCETICVPLQATLTLDAASENGPIEEAMIGNAFDALPAPASDAFGISGFSIDGDVLTLTANVPEGTGSTALFLAGRDGLMLEQPESDGTTTFTAKLPQMPLPAGASLDYTLSADGQAVDGSIVLD